MPSIKFHVSRSVSPPKVAEEIHRALDMPPGFPYFDIDIHMKWRKVTHNPLTAAFIGYIFNEISGMEDSLKHLQDDIQFNRLFYSRRSHNGEEEQENLEPDE